MDYRECIDGIIKNNLLKFFNNANEDCSDEFYKDKINNLIMYFENIDKDPKSLGYKLMNMCTENHGINFKKIKN